MELYVYKGFDTDFLKSLEKNPLMDNPIKEKRNVIAFDKKYRKQLEISLLNMEDDEAAWVTYEEYSLIKSRVDEAVTEDGLKVTIIKNNLYPDYYPIEFEIDEPLKKEINSLLAGDTTDEPSDIAKRVTAIYNTFLAIGQVLYVSFYNYEYDRNTRVDIEDYYPSNRLPKEVSEDCEYNLFLNEDIESYLRAFEQIKEKKPSSVGIKTTGGEVGKRILKSFQAFCMKNNILLAHYNEKFSENHLLEQELISIAQKDLNITGFKEFRTIPFYSNPDFDKEVINVSQGQIIQEIIHQAENAYSEEKNYRDIFITASTGAGKSVMFQIPAVYLAKKYNKLTIIIEPVKALMQDQKEKLNKSGYFRVESFNSDLITQTEKEACLKRIKEGEVDLLYLSPETLLSYSLETLIGDREVGLLIVDEAHIVTTWGVGFRPDYWYLGGYINRLRNQNKTAKGQERKTYSFPICAFTATAINGGIDDSVSDTIISLYMENPIKYIGYVKRDDIGFEIVKKEVDKKLPKAEYDVAKCTDLDQRLKKWLKNNEKTIVYFPYAKLARSAHLGAVEFSGLTVDKRIGTYTGRNIEEVSRDVFNEEKRATFEGFRSGEIPVILATKAFGMGVDVNDVQNIYHYAVTGNLCDYVQEIGRAARKQSMRGLAITDYYYNDMAFMNTLFGMSQIKQYEVKKVLEAIYNTYKSKNESKNFLISPESFTYIFKGNEDSSIGKIKTCLLMLEKDFYDKYNYKVLVTRPQSVFTKAYVCITKEHEKEVLSSIYGKYFKFMERGRYNELQADGSTLSDMGDIFSINLKSIWEKYHPDMSFPTFKYYYFNAAAGSKVMPEIREYIHPRQRVVIEARKDLILAEVKDKILSDFDYLADVLYSNFRSKYFTAEEFAKLIREKYGIAQARIIANSIFDLVDPDGKCIKHRTTDAVAKRSMTIANGNFKEFMRKPIIKSRLVSNMSRSHEGDSYSSYISLSADETSNTALKLLSIFNYITYEVVGGEQPEIFIRLNDPVKVRNIVYGDISYANGYVKKSKQKHERDVAIMVKFFRDLETDEERWNFIEEYFLGYDVLYDVDWKVEKPVKMSRSIDKENSYPTKSIKRWNDLKSYFAAQDETVINEMMRNAIPIPEYLETVIKKSDEGKDIIMSWPSKDVLICDQDTSDRTIEYFGRKGWTAYRIYEVNYEELRKKFD